MGSSKKKIKLENHCFRALEVFNEYWQIYLLQYFHARICNTTFATNLGGVERRYHYTDLFIFFTDEGNLELERV